MIREFSRSGYPLWANLIVSRFPEIFLVPNPNIFNGDLILAAIDPKDRVNLRFGFEGCHPGWAGLIEEIAGTGTALVKALRESGAQADAWIHSRIIQAKLGELRWSGDQNLREPYKTLFSGYVASVRARSTSVCMICGRYGEIRDVDGWLETLCDQDAKRTMPRRPPHE